MRGREIAVCVKKRELALRPRLPLDEIDLPISPDRNHVAAILNKLDVHSKLPAVIFAYRQHLV